MQSPNPLIAVGIGAVIVGSTTVIPAQAQSLDPVSVDSTRNQESLDPAFNAPHAVPHSSAIPIETMAIDTITAQAVALQVIELDVGAIELIELEELPDSDSVTSSSIDVAAEDASPSPSNQQALDRPVAYAMASEASSSRTRPAPSNEPPAVAIDANEAEVAEGDAADAAEIEESAAASAAEAQSAPDAPVEDTHSELAQREEPTDVESSASESEADAAIDPRDAPDNRSNNRNEESDAPEAAGEESAEPELNDRRSDAAAATLEAEEAAEEGEASKETEDPEVEAAADSVEAEADTDTPTVDTAQTGTEPESGEPENEAENPDREAESEATTDEDTEAEEAEIEELDREIDTDIEADTEDTEDSNVESDTPDASADEASDDREQPEEEASPASEADEEGDESESPDLGLTPETLDYLNPDANPLYFPTQPEEVELVGTQPITLEEAIGLAVRNNQELQQSRLVVERTRAALREAQALNYPDINANASFTFSTAEQADTETVFDPTTGFPIGTEIVGTEFQEQSVLGGALELNYPLYTSGRRPALIQSAERQVRLQELQLEADTADLALQVVQSYYNLQEADEQAQIFLAALNEAERSLRDAEALERAGVGTRFDVLQAQVDVANAQQDLRSQQSQQVIARERLVEQLNVPETITVSAADPVEVAGVWELSLEESIVEAYKNRAELQQQLVQREIAERNRRAALAQLGPQVNFQTSYSLNNDLEENELDFLSNFQAQVGVSLNIFDGGEARAQARQAEANIAIAETEFNNQRDQIRFEVEQAYSELDANFENIQTTALAVQQAQEALRLARLRFQAGVGTQTDVLRSQTELTRSRFNNLRAILDYNRALAALQRAVTNLPEGYLFDTP